MSMELDCGSMLFGHRRENKISFPSSFPNREKSGPPKILKPPIQMIPSGGGQQLRKESDSTVNIMRYLLWFLPGFREFLYTSALL